MKPDKDLYEVGDVILVKPESGLLPEAEEDIGIIISKAAPHSQFYCNADFTISKDVLLFEWEIVKLLPKEDYPEWYL